MDRPTFTVSVNTADDAGPTEHTALITHQDMLRGETVLRAETDKPGSLMLTTAWAWASLMRQGDYSGPWDRFRDVDCAGIEPGEDARVDPTKGAAPSA